jgi:hypothetical protein
VEKEGSSREDLLLMAEGSKATDCRSHEVQQRLVLCFSLAAGNSVAHRRKYKAYYSLSVSLCAFLCEENSAEDRRKCGRHSCNFCLEPCCKILHLFAYFDERHKNEEIAKLSLSLSLSLSLRQASRQLQQNMTMWIREKEESIGNDGE